MRKRLTAAAVAGTIGLGTVGAITYPAWAGSTPTPTPTPSASSSDGGRRQEGIDRRQTAIREALKGLVDDKTLTAEQADKVATTLAQAGPKEGLGGHGFGPGGRGGPGAGPRGGALLGVGGQQAEEAAAKALGLSADDVRTALRDGTTLAELAKKQGKDVDDVVNALVAVARQKLADAVSDGHLTKEMAATIEKTLPDRIREVVENGRPAGPFGRFGGPGRERAPGDTPTPPSSPRTPTPSRTGTSAVGWWA